MIRERRVRANMMRTLPNTGRAHLRLLVTLLSALPHLFLQTQIIHSQSLPIAQAKILHTMEIKNHHHPPQLIKSNQPHLERPQLNESLDTDNESSSSARLTRFKRRSKAASGKMPEFSSPIGNVTAVLGRDVRLICTVEHLGQYQVAWLKEESRTILSIDTNIIITNYRIFLIPDEEERKWVLHIKDVQESDRGFYQCQVNTNPMRSTSGFLEVVVPPTIIESQTSQVAETLEHSNVSLQCKASGHPKPTISWRRDDGAPIKFNGKFNSTANFQQMEATNLDLLMLSNLKSASAIHHPLAGDDNQQTVITTTHLNDIKSDRLSLFDVDRSIAGIYVCTASNGIPIQVSKRIPLYVKSQFLVQNVNHSTDLNTLSSEQQQHHSVAPKTSVQSKYISVGLGDQLEVDCLIEAFPKANTYWHKKASISQLMDADEMALKSSRPRERASRRALSFRLEQPENNESLQKANSSASVIDQLEEDLRAIKSNSSQIQADDPNLAAVGSRSLYNRLRYRQINSQLRMSADTLSAPNEPAFAGGLKGYVTVKQTAVNPYTYKLKLTIDRMQYENYGEYICISTNALGSSESHVIVTKANFAGDLRDRLQSLGEDSEYQRDSLENPSRPNNQQPMGSPRRPSAGKVYDENYLNAIKTRQNNNVGSLRLQQQQKLKLKQSSDRNSAEPKSVDIQKLYWSNMITVIFVTIVYWFNSISAYSIQSFSVPMNEKIHTK